MNARSSSRRTRLAKQDVALEIAQRSPHQQVTSPMKLRLVTCIHIAAYLFSALLLGASAFSYYRAIVFWNCQIQSEYTRIYFDEGHLLVWSFPKRPRRAFSLNMVEPFPINCVIEEFLTSGQTSHSDQGFPGIRRLRSAEGEAPFVWVSTLTIVPLWMFLIPQLTWMCGFHLVRFRQRIRARRSESSVRPEETSAP